MPYPSPSLIMLCLSGINTGIYKYYTVVLILFPIPINIQYISDSAELFDQLHSHPHFLSLGIPREKTIFLGQCFYLGLKSWDESFDVLDICLLVYGTVNVPCPFTWDLCLREIIFSNSSSSFDHLILTLELNIHDICSSWFSHWWRQTPVTDANITHLPRTLMDLFNINIHCCHCNQDHLSHLTLMNVLCKATLTS